MNNPIAMTTMMKEPSTRAWVQKATSDSSPPFAIVISTASSNIPITSSQSTTPKTSSRTLASTRTSSKALATMTAPEIETIAPVTRLCHGVQPMSRPVR